MTRSSDQNLVILTMYIIGVSYVFNRMVDSIDDKVKFEYKKGDVEEQLKKIELDEKIGISFKLDAANEFDDVKDLSISIENKSEDLAVYVDWDNSSLVIDHTKQSCRVIRKSPDLIRDLGVPQVLSLIAPKKTLSEKVSAENVYERDKDTGTYSAKKPVIDINGLAKNKNQKKLYGDFINERQPLKFSLQLVLRLSEVRAGLAPGLNVPPVCIIDCPFTVRKLPWTYALPWNKKK